MNDGVLDNPYRWLLELFLIKRAAQRNGYTDVLAEVAKVRASLLERVG